VATVKAFIRTSKKKAKQVKIRFRLSDGSSKQLFYCSNITIDPDNWDTKQQAIKPRPTIPDKEKVEINNSISKIKSIIQQIYLAEPEKETLTSAQLEYSIDRILNPDKYIVVQRKQPFFDAFDEYLSNRRVSKSQIAHNQVLKRMLQRFELYQKATGVVCYKLDLDTFTPSTIEDFEQFLVDEHEIYENHPKIYKAVPTSRKPIKRGKNTINGWLISLRSFFIWANKNDKTTNNPFRRYQIEECIYGTPIYITLEERNQIWEHKFSPETKYLEVFRDIFIFQCHIGCRVGDLFKMTPANLMGESIEYIPRKTKEGHPYTVSVPLTKIAQEIVVKYSAEAIISGKLLPFTYDQEYNKAIKKIFKEVGITRMVTFLNPTTREETKVPINTIAASHMARKTFIGNMYKKAKNATLVGALSGHVEGSRAFARYRNIDDEMKKELISIIE
jgi:intN1